QRSGWIVGTTSAHRLNADPCSRPRHSNRPFDSSVEQLPTDMRPATRGSISVDMLKPASPRPRLLDGAKRVMTNRASSHRPAITNQVRHDQRSREEDLAKDEVAEKAVPFAAGDTAGQKAMAVQMTANRI